jgi:hypothetical protein
VRSDILKAESSHCIEEKGGKKGGRGEEEAWSTRLGIVQL